MKVQAIIPAAGAGHRLKSQENKPLIEIHEKPLIIHCLERFEECRSVDSILLVVPENQIQEYKKILSQFHISKVKEVLGGGRERSDSVCHGIKKLDDDTDIVIVHDGARPCLSTQLLEKAIKACEKENAVIAAVPVKPTIKRVDKENMTVVATLDRQLMWEAQTPQVFKKEILTQAHQSNSGMSATDDAMLVEMLGEKVKVIEGDYNNIKVTTEEDLKIAQALLDGEKVSP